MHVISRPAIQQAIERHPDATGWLEKWWQNAIKNAGACGFRALYPAADQVDGRRLQTRETTIAWSCVSYANRWTGGTLLVKHFLTHAEYDKNEWRKDCYDVNFDELSIVALDYEPRPIRSEAAYRKARGTWKS